MRLYPHEFVAFEALQDVFASCQNTRIFLTGGTGFLGKWLLESFLRANKVFDLRAQIAVLSRQPKKFLAQQPWLETESSVTFVQGDVRNFTFPKGCFDFIIHAATTASAKLEQENPEEMYTVITEGTRHVLKLAKHCGAQRLLFISSGAVYGPQPASIRHLPETYEGVPATVYGKGKKISEQLCLDASEGRFECVIARPFAFVGPHLPLDTHFAIGNFIRDCLENRPITIRGDGTPLRSYLYAADLAEWLWTILLKGESGRAYNVGSDAAISIHDLALKVRQCAGTDNPVTILEKPNSTLPPPRYVPAIGRAMSELPLSIRTPLDTAITRTLAWYRAVRKPSER